MVIREGQGSEGLWTWYIPVCFPGQDPTALIMAEGTVGVVMTGSVVFWGSAGGTSRQQLSTSRRIRGLPVGMSRRGVWGQRTVTKACTC